MPLTLKARKEGYFEKRKKNAKKNFQTSPAMRNQIQ